MYFFSVAAIFKNEAPLLKEWIEHYLFHGAEHFYLFDDESTDDYYSVIAPYRDKITLLESVSWSRYVGRQSDIYTHYFLPKLAETEWLLVLDVDEFMWSPLNTNLADLLKPCDHLAEIQVAQTLYGSNGHLTNPPPGTPIVSAFTSRRASQAGHARTYGYKYFIHSKYPFKELTVHYAVPENEDDSKNRWIVVTDEYFVLNHYSCQSKDYFVRVKCKRTDADQFKVLTEADFPEFDTNEVEDTRLWGQNKDIYKST